MIFIAGFTLSVPSTYLSVSFILYIHSPSHKLLYISTAEGNSNSIPFQEFGHTLISSCFKLLSDELSQCPGVSLTNQLSSTGGYAWISCDVSLGSCATVLQKVNLLGLQGEVFGATNNC